MKKGEKSFGRKVLLNMEILVGILLALVLVLVGFLLTVSPGKTAPFLGEDGKPLPGSLSEKIHLKINGSDLGMVIKSRNVNNPVMLYIHGGTPDYFLTQDYPTGLENHYTMVWWEMRGSGLSFNPNIKPEEMTIDQLVSDTIELSKYLRDRFHKEKIYLMGHSGGSFFGILAAAKAPELYYAYIGQAQMTHQIKSEQIAYEYMLAEFRKNGNAKMVADLEKGPVTDSVPMPRSYEAARDVGMHSLGIGTIRKMGSVVSGLLVPSFLFPEYTLGEKVNLWRGKIFSGKYIWNKQLSTDLTKEVPELKIPVYFLHGIYDYTVNYGLARDYFDRLKAPVKGFYTFNQSAHSPMFEEPEKMNQIMKEDVLASKVNLADK